MEAGLVTALVVVAQALSPTPGGAGGDSSLVREGRELYADGCISCHGEQGEGEPGTGQATGAGRVQGAGPSLHDVGAASVDLYLSAGYMPLDDPRAAPSRSKPEYDREEIDALIAYVDSLGADEAEEEEPIPSVRPERGSVAEGLQLFTENCAGCHQVAAEGGITAEAVAPELEQATPTQVGEAIRVGPYMMPRFSEKQLSDEQVDSIAAYVEYAKDPDDEGGWGIGHIGPIPEGLAAWLIAGLGLVGVARLIGKRIVTEEEE